MNGVRSAPPAIFSSLQPVRVVFLILRGRVIAPLALVTRQGNYGTHVAYLPVMRKNFSTRRDPCQSTRRPGVRTRTGSEPTVFWQVGAKLFPVASVYDKGIPEEEELPWSSMNPSAGRCLPPTRRNRSFWFLPPPGDPIAADWVQSSSRCPNR